MSSRLIRCHRLAEVIMVAHAKELAACRGRRQDWRYFYDPLAATCLGDLIYSGGEPRRNAHNPNA